MSGSSAPAAAAAAGIRIAIVGAGLSGLACAREIQRLLGSTADAHIRVYERSGRAGGRLSLRRDIIKGSDAATAPSAGAPASQAPAPMVLDWDTGAQYFTARHPRFMREVQQWLAAGVTAPWRARVMVLRKGVFSDTRHSGSTPLGSLAAQTDVAPPSIQAPPSQSKPQPVSQAPPVDSDVRYVGTPAMVSITDWLLKEVLAAAQSVSAPSTAPSPAGTAVVFNANVVRLRPVGSPDRLPLSWQLGCEDGAVHGPFDHVVLALPQGNCVRLLNDVIAAPESASGALRASTSSILQEISGVQLMPCWALMVAYPTPLSEVIKALPSHLGGAFVHDSPLSWVANNSSKPARSGRDPIEDSKAATASTAAAGGGGAECWVLHASPEWSLEHSLISPVQAAELLHTAFAEALGVTVQALPTPIVSNAKLWRFASVQRPLQSGCVSGTLSIPSSGVGSSSSTAPPAPSSATPVNSQIMSGLHVCGDWCQGSRVEGAYVSGITMAQTLVSSLRSPGAVQGDHGHQRQLQSTM